MARKKAEVEQTQVPTEDMDFYASKLAEKPRRPSRSLVLVTGKTGTGKTVVALQILNHIARRRRAVQVGETGLGAYIYDKERRPTGYLVVPSEAQNLTELNEELDIVKRDQYDGAVIDGLTLVDLWLQHAIPRIRLLRAQAKKAAGGKIQKGESVMSKVADEITAAFKRGELDGLDILEDTNMQIEDWGERKIAWERILRSMRSCGSNIIATARCKDVFTEVWDDDKKKKVKVFAGYTDDVAPSVPYEFSLVLRLAYLKKEYEEGENPIWDPDRDEKYMGHIIQVARVIKIRTPPGTEVPTLIRGTHTVGNRSFLSIKDLEKVLQYAAVEETDSNDNLNDNIVSFFTAGQEREKNLGQPKVETTPKPAQSSQPASAVVEPTPAPVEQPKPAQAKEALGSPSSQPADTVDSAEDVASIRRFMAACNEHKRNGREPSRDLLVKVLTEACGKPTKKALNPDNVERAIALLNLELSPPPADDLDFDEETGEVVEEAPQAPKKNYTIWRSLSVPTENKLGVIMEFIKDSALPERDAPSAATSVFLGYCRQAGLNVDQIHMNQSLDSIMEVIRSKSDGGATMNAFTAAWKLWRAYFPELQNSLPR